MLDKIDELLARIEAEIENKVNEIVAKNDERIKMAAQAAYDNEVERQLAEIKEEVAFEYETAKKYLLELKASQVAPVVEEKTMPCTVEANVAVDNSEVGVE